MRSREFPFIGRLRPGLEVRRFRRPDVPGRLLLPALLLALAAASGCNYSFRGGSFPDHIRTLAILPFENETGLFEVTQEIHQFLLREVPRGLGVNQGAEENADAILRGTISRYNLETPLYRAGAPGGNPEVLQRQVSIGLQVELIDLVNNEILWEDGALNGQGQFLEASETEEVARQEAIERLAQMIIDGAQSTW